MNYGTEGYPGHPPEYDLPEGCGICHGPLESCACPECPGCGVRGDPKCLTDGHLGAWELFTKRTNDPKLRHLEGLLWRQGIPSRRNGCSFHADILEVPASLLDRAGDLLGSDVFGDGEVYDEIPDDDPVFTED